MEKIISEIAENFIKNICEKLSKGEILSQIEPEMLKEAKACAARLTEAYISQIDAQILADKTARRELGYSVERRGDLGKPFDEKHFFSLHIFGRPAFNACYLPLDIKLGGFDLGDIHCAVHDILN